VLLPPGWVQATQDDGLNTYTGPLSKMPVNPKFSKLKLPRDLYAALFGTADNGRPVQASQTEGRH
jgi:hypothetical protein